MDAHTCTMRRHPAPAFDVFNVFFERIYDPSIHLVLSFDGRLDEDALETATERLIAANPYLSSRFRVVDGRPVWEEIPADAREQAFFIDRSGRDPLADHPPPLDVRTAPQVRVRLSRNADGDTLTLTIHHGFCDAAGLATLARDLLACYRGILANPCHTPPSTGAYDRSTDRIPVPACDDGPSGGDAAPFVDRWRFPVERTGRGAPRILSRTLAPDRLARIRAWAKEHGATVNDVLIGAFFLALLRIRDDPSDRNAPRGILTSADMRRALPDPAACPPMNLSIAFELTLEVPDGAGLADIIGEITAVTTRCKAGAFWRDCISFYEDLLSRGMPAVEAFFDGMIERYHTSGQKNPVFSNLGVIDEAALLPVPGRDGIPLSLRDVRFIPCVCWPYGFLAIAATYRDRLTLTTAVEEGPYSPDTVERFLRYMDGYLP
ncbi:MAG: condensation protein [Methanomicrobiales archaeon]